jgi:hypothetical protein
MRHLLSCFVLVAALASGNAFAQEATAPAADAPAAPAAEGTPAPAVEAPAADATANDDAPAATVATPAVGVAPGKVGAPPAGKGQIVFFREKKFTGSAIRYKVREGQAELGKLISGSYFVVNVEPGQHTYVVHSEAKDVLTLEVEAGETYYVIGTITMGLFAGHPNLSPSDQATFDAMLAKLKLTAPIPAQ